MLWTKCAIRDWPCTPSQAGTHQKVALWILRNTYTLHRGSLDSALKVQDSGVPVAVGPCIPFLSPYRSVASLSIKRGKQVFPRVWNAVGSCTLCAESAMEACCEPRVRSQCLASSHVGSCNCADSMPWFHETNLRRQQALGRIEQKNCRHLHRAITFGAKRWFRTPLSLRARG